MSPRRNGRNRVEGQPRPEVTAGLQRSSRFSQPSTEPGQGLLEDAVDLIRRHPIPTMCVVAACAVMAGIALIGGRR
jgi:hypothetical protein